MSGQIFEVELPDGRIIEVEGAPDENAARQRVTGFLTEERRARPIDSFWESLVQSARQTGGAAIGAGEAAAAAAGTTGPRDFLSRMRENVEGQDANPQTRPLELRDFGSLQSFLPAIQSAAGQAFGSMVGIGGGALLGAGVGAAATGGPGAVPGAITGGLTAARAAGIGELYRGLVDEGVDPQTAGLIALPVGYVIGRIETRYLDDFLQRQLAGRVDPSVISRLAQRMVGGRAAGVRGTAAAGAVSEAGGEALRQGTIAGVTGNANMAERGEQVALEAIIGSLGGGSMGALNRVRGRAGEGTTPTPTSDPVADPVAAPAPTLPHTLPELPEEVGDVDEALRVIESNPQYNHQLNPNVSDEGILALANDIQNANYNDEVGAVRRRIIGEFFGEGDVGVVPATIDAEGKVVPGSTDYARAAPTLFTNVLNARGEGFVEGENFTPTQLLNAALAPYGLDASQASREDRRTAYQILDGMAAQGLLNKQRRGKSGATYSIAARPPQQTRQPARPGEAPQTEEDVNVVGLQSALAAWSSNPNDANLNVVNAVATTPLLKQLANDYTTAYRNRAVALQQQRQLIENINRANNTGQEVPVEVISALQESNATVSQLANILANIEEQLGGRAAGTLTAPQSQWVEGEQTDSTPEFSRQVGLSPPNIPPDWQEANDAARAGAERQRQESEAPAIAERDETQIANLLRDRPEEARQFISDLITRRKPGSLFSNAAIRTAAGELGIDMTPETATQVYDQARALGLVNALGVIPKDGTPTSPKKATPKANTPPPVNPPGDSGRAGREDSNDVISFSEPDRDSEGDARLGDERGSFAAAGSLPQSSSVNEPREAQEAFNRVVGEHGRLEWRDRILLADLTEESQAAAAELGIEGEVDGVAIGDLAMLSLANKNSDLVHVAIHEGVHVADRIGLITPTERKILNNSRKQILRVIEKYISPEFVEIARQSYAEMRAYGMNARIAQNADFGSFINRIFDKIRQLTDRIGNFLRGWGFTDWTQIYDRFYAGEMAGRQPDANWRNEIPSDFYAAQQSTPEFRKWFGNSQVVDINGQPKVVYHGTGANDITQFKTRQVTESMGAHFGTVTQANSIAKWHVDTGKPATVFPVYLKIENPLRMKDMGSWYPEMVFNELAANGIIDPSSPRARQVERTIRTDTVESTRNLQNYIKELGYDGIVYENEYEAGGGDSYIIFNPQQVKSATGNVGQFSNRSGHIGFHQTGQIIAANPRGAAAVVRRATTDQITGPLRWFGSPVMTISKVVPQQRNAADTIKQLYTRSQEMTVDVDTLIEPAHKLPPESVAKITRVWEAASRDKKKPNVSGLNPQELAALQGEMAAAQRGLNYFIESAAIHHFIPSDTKSPAINTRLEAFWTRHAGKHLWDIPQRELLAASPEGYREMQKYERIRNPYYMPMVGRGTHFVAAYKKGAGGKRGQLVGLVAYQPRNVIQKLRKFSDPEADAINQLRGEFDPARHIIMDRGQQFTNDSEAEQIRGSADFITQYMERLRQAGSNNSAVTKIIGEMSEQIDKATIERIFRSNQGVLRAITPQNESSYILDVMPQYLLSLAKIQARRYTQESYKDATKTLSVNDKEYWDTLRDYATTPTEAFGGLRASTFFYYLGGAIDTALINLTQNFHTGAYLARDGGARSYTVMARTMADLFGNLEVKNLTKSSGSMLTKYINTLPADERDASLKAIQQGIFTPVFTNESRSQFTVEGLRRAGFKDPAGIQRKLTKVSHYSGLLMASVEEVNRSVAFLSAYRLAKLDPSVITKANKIDNTAYKTPYDYAVGKVIDTQFLTTKEDRAYMQRFHPAAEVMTQFMSYPTKTIEQYARSVGQIYVGMKSSDPVLAKAGAVSLLGITVPLVMLAGVFGLPFADSLKEWSEKFIKAIWGDYVNLETEMQEMLGGGQFGRAIIRGIPHQQGVMSLQRRLALDPVPANDIANLSLATVAGPAGSLLIETPQNFYQYYQNGDYWQMAASVMPRAVGNVVRGMQLHFDEEQYTRRGNRVITPDIVGRVNERSALAPASVRQALGFPPPEFADERAVVGAAEEINQLTRGRSERATKELSRVLVDLFTAQRAGNVADMERYNRQYGERFREILMDEDRRPVHARINPQHSAILRRALRDFYGIGSEEAIRTSGRRQGRERAIQERAFIMGEN